MIALTPVQRILAPSIWLTIGQRLLDNRIVDVVDLIRLQLLLLNFNSGLPVRHREDFLQIQIELLTQLSDITD